MKVYALYTPVWVPIFLCFGHKFNACLGLFDTYEDAAGYAHNVVGFRTSEHFTIVEEYRNVPHQRTP